MQWHRPTCVYPRIPPEQRVSVLQWWPHTICTFFSMNKVYTNATSQYEGYITYSLQTKSWLKRPFGKHPGCKCGIILHKISGDNSAFLLLVLPCAKKQHKSIVWKTLNNPVCQWLSQNARQQMSRKAARRYNFIYVHVGRTERGRISSRGAKNKLQRDKSKNIKGYVSECHSVWLSEIIHITLKIILRY